ncbi:MAG: hypothetical protein RO469_03155 [Thermincola sp.]|jgi:hypothetical protein|nr:hypothetical protein [Thermincola sp.]MDT3703186.1 hypothetical protein [Thermincola sp.]
MFTVMLKIILCLTVGIIFWFFAFLVFMVYAFMPVTKLLNSVIFAIAAPALYLIMINVLLKKIFKETGWPNIITNLFISAVVTGVSLYLIDLTSRIIR